MVKKVSVIIPVYNEEQNIRVFFQRIRAVSEKRKDLDWSFIFVDDGSSDRSRIILDALAEKHRQCKVIHFSRNFGHQMAVTAGIDFVDGDFTAIIDGDMQDPPELLLQMIKEIENGYNIVYGQRKKRDGETWFKLGSAKLFYRLLNSMTKVDIPVDTGDFRVIDNRVLRVIKEMRESHRFIRGMVAWVGFRSKPILYSRDARYAGETKYPLVKMVKFAFDAIFSFSNTPLRIANFFGITITCIGFLGILDILRQWFILHKYMPGVTAVLFAVLFVGGVQLIILGIIGEYVGRIFEHSKGRPLYIVDDVKNLEGI